MSGKNSSKTLLAYGILIMNGFTHDDAHDVLNVISLQDPTPEPQVEIPAPSHANPYRSTPLSAHSNRSVWMQEVMRHLYKTYNRPISPEELWGECQKCSSKGGRAPTLVRTTFNQYLSNYTTGKNQANGTILWKRVGRGQYVPA